MSAISQDVPTMDVDLWDWGFNQDPYPTLEAIPALGPVVYNPVYDHDLVTSRRNCAWVIRAGSTPTTRAICESRSSAV